MRNTYVILLSVLVLVIGVAFQPLPAGLMAGSIQDPLRAEPREPSPVLQPAPDNAEDLIRDAVQAFLSGRQSAPGNPVQIVAVQAVVWPDSCLGISTPGIYCLQVLTPGYRMQVELNGSYFTVHTDEDGSSVRVLNLNRGAGPIAGPPMAPPVAPPPVTGPGQDVNSNIAALVVAFISQHLNVPADAVEIVSVSPARWPDSCLGITPPPGIDCMQVITPGFLVIVRVNGVEIEVRTNEDGTNIQIASGMVINGGPVSGPGLPGPVRPPIGPRMPEREAPSWVPEGPISREVPLPVLPVRPPMGEIDRFLPDR